MPSDFSNNPDCRSAEIIGTGATLNPDAVAVGTGTVGSLTDATTLSSLGIAAGDKIMIGDGTNTTTYTSTGTDTVGDLINAINAGTAGNATVTASLSGGNLVLTGNNFTSTVSVTGSGASDAADLGFGSSNNTFPPTNLLTQGLNGKTLTVSVGGGAPQTITFGTGAGDVATLGELQTAVQNLTGVIGSVNTANGDIKLLATDPTATLAVGRHGLAVDLRHPERELGAGQRDGHRQRCNHLHQSIGRWRLHHRLRHRRQSAQYSVPLGASRQQFRPKHLEFVLPDQFQRNRHAGGLAEHRHEFHFQFQRSAYSADFRRAHASEPDRQRRYVEQRRRSISASNGLTQFANSSGSAQVTQLQQNGFAAGQLQSVAVDSENRVVGTFTNGQTIPLAQITLATFNGENSLQALNGGAYAATADSGPPIYGATGKIDGSSLESSNVDISTQFSAADRGAAGLFGQCPRHDDGQPDDPKPAQVIQ